MNTTLKTGLLGLLLTAAGANAEELGRLFFTPEQRAQLEYSQQQGDSAPATIHSLTVNGVVQKHGGQRTVWINGVPRITGKSNDKTPENVTVDVPGQSKPVRAKVGQRVLINPAASGQ